MLLPIAISACLGLLAGPAGAEPEAVRASLATGRCAQNLPLDAGEAFDGRRHLIWNDETFLFEQEPARPGAAPEVRWRLASRTSMPSGCPSSGLLRCRRKWRDGALWMASGTRIFRWDPGRRVWLLEADPGLEFMDFEVDLSGRILLVCTADPRARTYRALLELVEPGAHATRILAPYPDPGCQAWGARISPVAAATLQVGYEAVQLLEFIVLYNPLARRVFIYQPLEDKVREAKLTLPTRSYRDLLPPPGGPAEPLDDLCWQVLPHNGSEAWIILPGPRDPDGGPRGLQALPLNLAEASAGDPVALVGDRLPLFPDPGGRLRPLDQALEAFAKPGF